MTRFRWLLIALLLPATAPLAAQTRSMAQDSSLDNLRLPVGTDTAAAGTLGRVRRSGEGPRTMLLLSGMGFGDGTWTEFMERHRADYRMYAITLPGFGGTPPPAMPAQAGSYGDTPWIRSSVRGIEALLERERIARVTIVAHWAVASQIALRMALDHPDRVEAVILIGAPLKAYYDATPAMMTWTREQRVRFADGMGQRWFRTVTRHTWDDNNFMAYDYAVNPRRGLFLWREAQAPALPVWIRYLLEFYAMDLSAELGNLRTPTLVVQPGFDDPGYYVEPNGNYMRSLCIESWRGAAELSRSLEFVTIPQSRLFVMFDQPERLDSVMTAFLARRR